MTTPFDTADFFTCDPDAEEYVHTTPAAAIAEWLDEVLDDFDSVVGLRVALGNRGPLTVYAVKRHAGWIGWYVRVGSREYSAEEVEAMMRVEQPGWFEGVSNV